MHQKRGFGMKKGGKDFTPCRPNRIRTSEQKNCSRKIEENQIAI